MRTSIIKYVLTYSSTQSSPGSCLKAQQTFSIFFHRKSNYVLCSPIYCINSKYIPIKNTKFIS